MAERIDSLDNPNLFLSGPAEFLAQKVAENIALVPQFSAIFGPRIDGYRRMDYSLRELPAIRIYNNEYYKEFESWFITGELLIDVIFPGNVRRSLEQQYQDTVTSALCQQFRRVQFFEDICTLVPGLNELGKTFNADKSLGFMWGQGSQEPVPMTQIRANFRLDLRVWDEFLISDDRTKADPFERTLGDLESIYTLIKSTEGGVEIQSEQTIA